MRPRICVSIQPKSISECAESLHRARQLSADLVEVRLDDLSDTIPHHLAKQDKSRLPLIATDRSSSGSDDQRLDLLFDAVEAGFDFVDVSIETDNLEHVLEKFRKQGPKIILSTHDHAKTPSRQELDKTLAEMISIKPDVCKLVTTATTLADNLTVLNLLEEHHHAIPLICVAMGERGKWSRVLGPLYGAPFTYASLQPGEETAPGQLSISELRQIYAIMGSV